MNKFKPLYNHVIVKKQEQSTQTLGNIIVPDMDDKKPFYGEVIACGEGDISATGQLVEMKLKPGDKVIFGNFSGVKFNFEGEEYICLKDREIFTIIKD